MIKQFCIALLVSLIMASPLLSAQGPMETAKTHIDKIVDILKNPALTGESGKQAKIEQISQITEDAFDFTELSKRSLGQAWAQFSPEQQKEFISLYKQLLKNTYADKIVSYNNEKIDFGKEVPLSDTTAEIQTSIHTNTGEVPINYRMIKENDSWRVYDVVIEGVSLINNYRTQFREILANKTPQSLIDILKKKVQENVKSK